MVTWVDLVWFGLTLFCLALVVGVVLCLAQAKLATIRHIDRPPPYLLVGLMLLLAVGASEAQTTRTVTFAWDYDVSANASIDGFELERKDGQQGTYAPVPVTIAPTARTVSDPTASVGMLQCWRLFAVKPPKRSTPSNEVCDVQLLGPINFRVQ